MRLRFNQLKASLDETLAPVYLITGDEPLQVMLAADAVRAAARARDYQERLILDVEAGFDWAALREAATSLSLFAQRRLLDLRMPGKPGAAGAPALTDYARQPPPDTVLLVQCARLDKAAANTTWVKALERAGVMVQVWPLAARETRQWIQARLIEKGLKVSPDALSLLAERGQGNLLAANQEIEKLSLLYGDTRAREPLSVAEILVDVADSARFNVFELAETALAGHGAQAARILQRLIAEDVKPALVLWSLSDRVRALAAISGLISQGASVDRATAGINQSRRIPMLKMAYKRKTAAAWTAWLRRCARIDRMIKGQEPGNPWDELLVLTMSLCGQPLFDIANERIR